MEDKVRNAAAVGGWYKVLCLPDSPETLMGWCCNRGDCPATTHHLLFLLVCLNCSNNLCHMANVLFTFEISGPECDILSYENEGLEETFEDL